MAALDIILEITLHCSIDLQFFLCQTCLRIEIHILERTALAVTFQIIMDHPVNDKIARDRETERPFVIDHGNPVIVDQDICRNQIDIGDSTTGKCSFL